MAAKQPQRRPTEAQLIKSQKRIRDYLVASGETFESAAKEFGTTPRRLRNFLFGSRKVTLKNFPRNQSAQKLYNSTLNVFDSATETVTKTTQRRVGGAGGRIVTETREVPKRVKAFRGPIKGVAPYEKGTGTESQERYYQRLTQSINLETEVPSLQMALGWQKYTASRDLPTSIEDIKELYADGELTKRQVSSILTHWHSIYSNMSDEWYDDMVDQFADYDDLQ